MARKSNDREPLRDTTNRDSSSASMPDPQQPSEAILENVKKVRANINNLKAWNLDWRVRNKLVEAKLGFFVNAMNIGEVDHSAPLLDALAKFYSCDDSHFNFPCGKISFEPREMEYITGLPGEGKLISLKLVSRPRCLELWTAHMDWEIVHPNLNSGGKKGSMNPAPWLKKNFEQVVEGKDIEMYARAFILYQLSALFTDLSGSAIHAKFLEYVCRDFHELHEYAWGAALVEYMHTCLKNCLGGAKTRTLCGPCFPLMIFSLEHFPKAAELLIHQMSVERPESLPLMTDWSRLLSKPMNNKRRVELDLVKKFEGVFSGEICLQPYERLSRLVREPDLHLELSGGERGEERKRKGQRAEGSRERAIGNSHGESKFAAPENDVTPINIHQGSNSRPTEGERGLNKIHVAYPRCIHSFDNITGVVSDPFQPHRVKTIPVLYGPEYCSGVEEFLKNKIAKGTQIWKKRNLEVLPHEPFAPLTLEARNKVLEKFNSKDEQKVLASREGFNITVSILRSLQPKMLVQCEVINFYFLLLEERAKRNPDRYLNCYFFKTYLYQKLSGGYNYQSIQSWTSKCELKNFEKIFIPINKDRHWFLAVIDPAAKKIQHLDSLTGDCDREVMGMLAKYYVDDVKDKSGIDVKSLQFEYVLGLPKQKNAYDCGVFVMKFAEFYSSRLLPCFGQEHMEYFRYRIAKEIIDGGLTDQAGMSYQ